jgi:hypothetical protein
MSKQMYDDWGQADGDPITPTRNPNPGTRDPDTSGGGRSGQEFGDWVRAAPFNWPLGLLGVALGIGFFVHSWWAGKFSSLPEAFLGLVLPCTVLAFTLGKAYRVLIWLFWVVFFGFIALRCIDYLVEF